MTLIKLKINSEEITNVKSIRLMYENFGVEEYYSTNLHYKNPHEPQVIELIKKYHLTLPLECVLDLSCGNGLITNTLQILGYKKIIGLDPFLDKEYTFRTGCLSYKMSFKDIVNNGLTNEKFSCIICSFALHLCPKSMLPDLFWRLSEISNTLVVISPSKFPIIKNPLVEDFSLTSLKKRVHFRRYNLPIIDC